MVWKLARTWARRENFVGNVIRWTEVIEHLRSSLGIPVDRRPVLVRGDWEEETSTPSKRGQATLQDMGVTGGRQTVGTGGTARTDKHRARCKDLPEVRGPPTTEEEWEGEPRWSNTTEETEEMGGREEEEGACSGRTPPESEDEAGGRLEAEMGTEAEEGTADGDGPAETEGRGYDGGGAGKTPGAAWPGSRVAHEARRVGGQRLPAAQGGGGKNKIEKQLDKTQRLEGSGAASTPVASRRGWSGLGGGRSQGGAGGAWGHDEQGACDRPSGKPPD